MIAMRRGAIDRDDLIESLDVAAAIDHLREYCCSTNKQLRGALDVNTYILIFAKTQRTRAT